MGSALTISAIGGAFAGCAWVVAAGTAPWHLTPTGIRRRRQVFGWLLGVAVACELAALLVVAVAA